MNAPGFNPLRWKCEAQGCFNVKRRPKIEQFAHCLPGRLAFSDVDAVAEVNGQFLFLEWKSEHSQSVPTGQRILFERLTLDPRCAVLVISGDAESMEISGYSLFWAGRQQPWTEADIHGVSDRISRWTEFALGRQRVVA